MIKRENVKFEFDPKRHVYTFNGKRMYGVTNVLNVINKPALIQWAVNEAVNKLRSQLLEKTPKDKVEIEDMLEEARFAHRKKKEEGATAGTDIHETIEILVKEAINTNNGKLLVTNHEEDQIQKFIDWAISEDITFIASERKLYSEVHWFAGTCDLIFKKGKKTFVGDIKTTSGIYDRTPFFQMGAYQIMLEEEGETYDGRCVIRLGKDGSFEVVYSYSPLDKEGFLHALALFKALEVPVTAKQGYIKRRKLKKLHGE